MAQLCRKISVRHVSYKKSERTRRDQILREQMIAAIGGLTLAAIPACRRNTALALKQPDLFQRRARGPSSINWQTSTDSKTNDLRCVDLRVNPIASLVKVVARLLGQRFSAHCRHRKRETYRALAVTCLPVPPQGGTMARSI